ncbi:hypothetical protein PYCCODRAFT_1424028 [Trametes coccinea BRFM310]|uniref:Transmembrane protein n=1 Tax=Trametes coccinea (strain BRFM310) TaxID=1353009 RepID=A0A1Y2IU72_TRAC3|nr:hypothetical protein PYCCODRAFT_1424028 [Trametes coccinea BRFM310]
MRSCSRAGIIIFFALVTISSQLVWAVPAQKDASDPTSSSPSSTPDSASATVSRDAQETHAATHGPAPDGKDDATQTDLSNRQSSTQSHSSTTSPHSILIPPTAHHSRPHTSFSPSPGHPITHHFPPNPPPTAAPISTPAPAAKSQPPIAIAFEVLGGIIALLVLLGLARCFIVWRRTPARDRIAALVDRHQLEREMEEQERERMERLSRALEARRWRPPPPPYQPAPEYEEVVRSESPE